MQWAGLNVVEAACGAHGKIVHPGTQRGDGFEQLGLGLVVLLLKVGLQGSGSGFEGLGSRFAVRGLWVEGCRLRVEG